MTAANRIALLLAGLSLIAASAAWLHTNNEVPPAGEEIHRLELELRAQAERSDALQMQIESMVQELANAARQDSLSSTDAPIAQLALHQYAIPQSVEFCGEALPLEDPVLFRRFEGEWNRFLNNRHWMLGWMRRAPEVFPLIEERLAAAGLPEDLKYIAAIESALEARALSSAGARGWWQFMAETGRRHGLTVNKTTDERRELELATDAAIDYLSKLHKEFDSWPLALASYNAGESRIRGSIRDQGTNDYFQLVLPRETENYVFRAAAVKTIYENAEAYGFVLNDDPRAGADLDLAHVRLKVKAPGLLIRELGEAVNLSYREFKDLNPQFRLASLPAGEHRLLLPRSSISGLAAALPAVKLMPDPPRRGGGAELSDPGVAADAAEAKN